MLTSLDMLSSGLTSELLDYSQTLPDTLGTSGMHLKYLDMSGG